ncbi:hypothetical protein F3K40_15230 [Streptomyces sp. LBUM 1478]|uniref:hypothetical protein n=1 Tax=Streptomyces scabiei TaxID=1930 RepID=UPI0007661A38|nr:hypothetical protein [Streptomyces scabiei]MBP5906809.1 hypothetical protein [Streptomyces sp. LBUM 1478]
MVTTPARPAHPLMERELTVTGAPDGTETFEGVDSRNVHVGDRLQFMTRETGFNGRGLYVRTGVVVKVTEKTVRVDCGDNYEGTAVLRKDIVEWHSRDVRRVIAEQPARRPYNAENVHYVDHGLIVTAVWVSDPTVDPAVALENVLCQGLPYEVEVIAEATRFYKKEGAGFSGWVVSSHGGLNYGDSIPNKRQAMKELGRAVADCFTR